MMDRYIDWNRSRDVAIGIAVETAGRALGWAMWLAGAWIVLALIIGTAVMVEWIGAKL
jgi:hypothetical protein